MVTLGEAPVRSQLRRTDVRSVVQRVVQMQIDMSSTVAVRPRYIKHVSFLARAHGTARRRELETEPFRYPQATANRSSSAGFSFDDNFCD